MWCNLALPILRGNRDHLLCKWPQSFQTFLCQINTHLSIKPIKWKCISLETGCHNVWSHSELVSRNSWKNVKTKLSIQNSQNKIVWLCMLFMGGIENTGNTMAVSFFLLLKEQGDAENISRRTPSVEEAWKRMRGQKKVPYVFVIWMLVWVGSWQLSGNEMEFYTTSYTNISTAGFVSVDIFRNWQQHVNLVFIQQTW